MIQIQKSFRNALLLLSILSTQLVTGQGKDPAGYVNPFLGTDFFGHTYPGAALPFAMVHVSPDTGTEGWKHCAGYVYSASTIIGFSHTHWSGVGMVDGGDILLMPSAGDKLFITPGTEENPDEGYRSRFSHARETASPGYYSVFLDDYGIRAELTATTRAAFHKYTFPESDNARIILDLGHKIGKKNKDDISYLSITGDRNIEGEKSDSPGKIYFAAEFSKPFLYYGTFDAGYATPESGSGIFPYKNGEKGSDIGAFVTFRTDSAEEIMVKVAISYTGIEGARKNLQNELPHWNFNQVKNEAYKIWNDELSKVKTEGATEEHNEIFYTALYHSLLAQYINQDYDGTYYGADGKIHIARGYNYYGSFSCWDTYRSQHPLLTLIAPEHVNDFIKSIVAKTKEYGWLPAQHFQNVFGEGMTGDHLVPVIVDAYVKNFRDYDVGFIYGAMKKKALELPQPPAPGDAGRSGLTYLIDRGYIPADKVTESVPKTIEFSYDDWCIAQLAKELGYNDDYKLFMKRALNYKNLWDEKSGFMRPRNLDGSWLEHQKGRTQEIISDGDHTWYKYFDPLLVGRRPNRHYTESNAWQYLWAAQHDIEGLINLMGGNDKFVVKLDSFFNASPVITPPKYVGVVGTIGQYVHGNQPSHHVAYLYNYAGKSWKTQERVREIMERLYKPGPGGLCGNEDMGSLSSWYILSAMGFYPATPGSPYYMIGSPLFDKITVRTGEHNFTIIAHNNSSENRYIQTAQLNGKPLNRSWLLHSEIVDGGLLEFNMGPKPAKNRDSKFKNLPLLSPEN